MGSRRSNGSWLLAPAVALLRAVLAQQTRTLRDLAARGRLAQLPAEPRARWEVAASRYAREHANLEAERAALAERSKKVQARALPALDARLSQARRALQDEMSALLPKGLRAEGVAPPDDPHTDTGLLVVHPLGAGILVLLAAGGHVQAVRVPALTGGEAPWLERLAPTLEGLSRLRLLVHPSLDGGGVQSLPWRGRRLDEAFSITYTLTGRPPADTFDTAPPRALVVGDPGGSLPSARREAALVRDALEASGVPTDLLVQAGASRAALVTKLGQAGLFHFAGHATFDPREPWQSALVLAEGTRFDVADVLALERTPRIVFLSACEAVRFDGEAIGIGLAFALAGSSAVIGPTRPVPDHIAGRLAAAIYGKLGASDSPIHALRDATTTSRVVARDAEVELRVYEP